MKLRYKVLHLITHLGIGGAQDNTLYTARELDRSAYEVHIASGTDETNWLERARACSDKLYIINNLQRSINFGQDIKALKHLIKLIRHEGYDIIHTHSSKAGTLGRLAAHLAKVPIIVHTVHGLAWNPYMPARSRIFYRLTERYLSRFTNIIITVCETNRKELIKLRITPEYKITTIYSGIDTSCFEKQIDRNHKCFEIGLDPNRPIVGTVARLSEQKAPLDFVAAARLISQKMPNVQFVMVGDGPLRSHIQASIKDMQNVVLLGARSDVPELLQIFDVFALASLWEGLGRALTEALLVECPVAVTAVDGVPEVVTDGLTGLLSPPKHPQLLANNIIRLLSDHEFAKTLGSRGSRLVQQQLTISSMVDRIDKLYLSLLAQNQATSMEIAR